MIGRLPFWLVELLNSHRLGKHGLGEEPEAPEGEQPLESHCADRSVLDEIGMLQVQMLDDKIRPAEGLLALRAAELFLVDLDDLGGLQLPVNVRVQRGIARLLCGKCAQAAGHGQPVRPQIREGIGARLFEFVQMQPAALEQELLGAAGLEPAKQAGPVHDAQVKHEAVERSQPELVGGGRRKLCAEEGGALLVVPEDEQGGGRGKEVRNGPWQGGHLDGLLGEHERVVQLGAVEGAGGIQLGKRVLVEVWGGHIGLPAVVALGNRVAEAQGHGAEVSGEVGEEGVVGDGRGDVADGDEGQGRGQGGGKGAQHVRERVQLQGRSLQGELAEGEALEEGELLVRGGRVGDRLGQEPGLAVALCGQALEKGSLVALQVLGVAGGGEVVPGEDLVAPEGVLEGDRGPGLVPPAGAVVVLAAAPIRGKVAPAVVAGVRATV